MYQDWKPGQLRDIGYYLLKSLKFYELKNERLTPVLFTIMLGIAFLSQFIVLSFSDEILGIINSTGAEDVSRLMDNLLKVNTINIITNLILNLISTVYLTAFLREQRGQSSTTRECLSLVARKSLLIVFALVFYVFTMLIGALLLIIPGIIAYIAFTFNTCIIIDKGTGVIKAFKQSAALTKGYRIQLFGIIIVFFLLPFIPSMFVAGVNNTLIYVFIVSFISVIFNLMYQRLLASMYIDLQHDSIGE